MLKSKPLLLTSTGRGLFTRRSDGTNADAGVEDDAATVLALKFVALTALRQESPAGGGGITTKEARIVLMSLMLSSPSIISRELCSPSQHTSDTSSKTKIVSETRANEVGKAENEKRHLRCHQGEMIGEVNNKIGHIKQGHFVKHWPAIVVAQRNHAPLTDTDGLAGGVVGNVDVAGRSVQIQ